MIEKLHCQKTHTKKHFSKQNKRRCHIKTVSLPNNKRSRHRNALNTARLTAKRKKDRKKCEKNTKRKVVRVLDDTRMTDAAADSDFYLRY